MVLRSGYQSRSCPTPRTQQRRSHETPERGCCQEEAGTSCPSWMLAELQKPGANCRHRV